MSITITNNTLPYPEDQIKVEKALNDEIASLPGEYTLSIVAPPDMMGCIVKVRSVDGLQDELRFSGPAEEDPAFIANAVKNRIQEHLG